MNILRIIILILTLFSQILNAQWEKLNGPYGGDVKSLVTKDGKVFASVGLAGIYESNDNGINWTLLTSVLTEQRVEALAANYTTLFAGTFWGRIFKSTDNGKNWIYVYDGSGITSVKAFAVLGEIIFAAGNGGIIHSTDNGVNWIKENYVLADKEVSSLVVEGNNLFAGTTSHGVYKSTDSGTSWSAFNNGIETSHIRRITVLNNDIYASTYDKLFRSEINTNNWNQLTDSLSVETLFSGNGFIIAGTNLEKTNLYRSSDRGSNWQIVNNKLGKQYIRSIISNNDYLIAGGKGGIYISEDNGLTWQTSNNGIEGLLIYSLTGDKNNIFIGSGSRGVFHSTNKGLSWTSINQGLKNHNTFTLTVHNNYIFGSTAEGVYRANNNNYLWENKNNGLAANTLDFAKLDNNILCGTYRGLFRSSNNGENWDTVNTNLQMKEINKIGVNNGHIFIATLRNSYSDYELYLSTDDGNTWETVSSNLPNKFIKAIQFIDEDIYVGTLGDGVFVSTNNGSVWKEINNGLTNQNIYHLEVEGNHLFAGTYEGGVFHSSDFGESWTEINTGLNNLDSQLLKIQNEYIYYSGMGQVFRRPLTEFGITDIQDDKNIPTNFTLEQNYPNPFNPTTTIKFSVADAFHASTTKVTLKIYDVLGNKITTLVNDQKQPGIYEVTFDGSNLSSGVYFYSLKVAPSAGSGEAFNQTKKLILMK